MSGQEEIAPTDEAAEKAKGRIALWLDPEDLWFLAEQYQNLPPEAPMETVRRWGVINFRAHAALHKAGLKEQDPDRQ